MCFDSTFVRFSLLARLEAALRFPFTLVAFSLRTRGTVAETNYHRHAVEIARGLNINLYDGVACVSGDGIPTEVSAASSLSTAREVMLVLMVVISALHSPQSDSL